MKELFKLPIAEVIEFTESFITLSGGQGGGQEGGMGGWGPEE